MNKKLVLILTALGCGTLLFVTVLVAGAGFFIYQSAQKGMSDFQNDFLTGIEDVDYEIFSAHVYAYTEIGAHYLGDRMKAAHPDHKVLLFCAIEPKVERDDMWIDVDMRKAIERGLAKAYGEGNVTTVYIEVQPLTEAELNDEIGYYYDYKVSLPAYTAAMAQADANTVCVWTLPLPKDFRTLPQATLPPASSPVFTLIEVDTIGLNDLIASGHIAAAVDFRINDEFEFEADIPVDRDTAFNSLYYYIDAATIPAVLKEHDDYFEPYSD